MTKDKTQVAAELVSKAADNIIGVLNCYVEMSVFWNNLPRATQEIELLKIRSILQICNACQCLNGFHKTHTETKKGDHCCQTYDLRMFEK